MDDLDLEKPIGWSFYDILESEIIKKYSKELLQPITDKLYKTTYSYLWIICIYSILLFIVILANFLLLIKIYWKFSCSKIDRENFAEKA